MSDRTNAEQRDRVTLREGDKRPTAPLLAPLGSMPGGLEFPPRRYPPDPQHLDIPQTYDPRVSVQLERTARDIAAGMPEPPRARMPNARHRRTRADHRRPRRARVSMSSRIAQPR